MCVMCCTKLSMLHVPTKKSISGVVELSWQRAIFLIFNSLGIYFFFLSAKNGNMAMRER